MASFDLLVRPLDQSSRPPDCVVPFVDGRDLVELMTEHERSEGYDPAGGYAGIVPTSFDYGPLLDYFLGARHHRNWAEEGKIAVLGCACGEVGCWPFHTRVDLSATEVTWSAFEQPHRPSRGYDGFGPFTFDRRQYEAAAAEVATAFDRPGR